MVTMDSYMNQMTKEHVKSCFPWCPRYVPIMFPYLPMMVDVDFLIPWFCWIAPNIQHLHSMVLGRSLLLTWEDMGRDYIKVCEIRYERGRRYSKVLMANCRIMPHPSFGTLLQEEQLPDWQTDQYQVPKIGELFQTSKIIQNLQKEDNQLTIDVPFWFVLGLLEWRMARQHCRVASTGNPQHESSVHRGRAKMTEEYPWNLGRLFPTVALP